MPLSFQMADRGTSLRIIQMMLVLDWKLGRGGDEDKLMGSSSVTRAAVTSYH